MSAAKSASMTHDTCNFVIGIKSRTVLVYGVYGFVTTCPVRKLLCAHANTCDEYRVKVCHEKKREFPEFFLIFPGLNPEISGDISIARNAQNMQQAHTLL